MMSTKREAVERAIEDLKRNLEDLKQAQGQLDSAFPRSRRPDDFIQRDMEDTMKDRMMQLFRERANIANRLFRDYPTSYPNDNYYDPNPTPVFNMGDFASRDAPGKQNRYPIMVGPSTKSESRIDSTIRRVETFINQLKRKLSRRKDLQENSLFQLTEAKLKSLINQVIKESQNNPTQLEEGMVAEALEFCQYIAESAPNPRLIQHVFMEKDSKFVPVYGMTIDHALQRIAERDAYFNQGVKQDLSRTSKSWNKYEMFFMAFPDEIESLSDEMKQEANRKDIKYALVKITIMNNETTPGEPLSIDFKISHGLKSQLGRLNVLFESSDFNEIRGDLYGFVTEMFHSKEALAQQVIDMA